MTDPDFWAQVRRQRDAQQPPAPRDRVLWCLLKGQQRAEAVARLIDSSTAPASICDTFTMGI